MRQLTETEKALIMGTLLGDGTMIKRGNSYRLRIAHGIKQKNYVLWKRKQLENLCETTQDPVIKTDQKGYQTVEIYLTSGEYLKEIFHLFYKEQPNDNDNDKYRKTITPELIEKLPMNPLVLAVFFMDDGSVRSDSYAGKLATQSFCFFLLSKKKQGNKEENELLCSYLKKWNIDCNVVFHSREKNQYYLAIPAKSFGVLVKEIESIVREIPEMCYKLNYQRKPRND